MDHIAVDLGGRKSYVVVRDQSGKILERRSIDTDALGDFLRRKAPGRVVMETCAEAFSIADQALAAGHEARVIPSSQVRALGIGSHGIKTDRRDGEVLSDVSTKVDLKGVHIPSKEARELKAKLAARDALVTSKVALLNTIRGILRCTRTRVRASTAKAFAKGVRQTFANRQEQTPPELERLLICLLVLDEQLEIATDELDEISEKDPVMRRLRTAPGVGPVVSTAFVAALDCPDRFLGAHAVQSYLGVVPGEDSSSERQRRTGITKAGQSRLRRLLVQAAWQAMIRHQGDPMVQWAIGVALRQGKRKAVVALARKLSGILFAMWRDGVDYDPRRGAAVLQGDPA